MARNERRPHETDSKETLLECLILAGLFAGFALFLVVSAIRGDSDQKSPPQADLIAAANAQTIPAADGIEQDLSENARGRQTKIETSASKPRPNVAERLKAFALEKARNPLAAVADKPWIPSAANEIADAPQIQVPDVTEASLRADLVNSVPIAGLNRKQSEAALDAIRAAATFSKRPSRPVDGVLALLPESDADGLPFAEESDCRLEEPAARALDEHAGLLHSQLSLADQSVKRRFPTSANSRRDPAMIRAIEKGNWQSEDAIPALFQILQVETEPVRGQLVEMAAKHRNGDATAVLVNRALFDLSPEVREKAVAALKWRSPDYYRTKLLEAIRHPWSPVAWNAAKTLVALGDREAVPGLIKLLDAPNPAKPHRDEAGNMVVKELVRIHHMQNCLLCHAPAQGTDDLVQGKVPDERVAVVSGVRRGYYTKSRVVRPKDVFVRADVTYLRQDFSLMHAQRTGQAGTRFDYLVRTRNATEEEIASAEATPADSVATYPQREAVLYAIQELTRENRGTERENGLALKP